MKPSEAKRPLLRRALRIAAAVAVTLVFSLLLERDDGLGSAALSLRALTSSRDHPARVKVVRIDDQDYQRLFGARSPMDPATLARIIRAIAAGGPAVIGVDVESIDPAHGLIADSVAGVPIVWARQFRCIRSGVDIPACGATERIPQRAGGRPDPGREQAGLVMLPEDQDGALRRYTRVVRTNEGDLPAFSTAVLAAAGMEVGPEPSETFRLIRYRRSSAADSLFTARWVIQAAESGRFARTNGVFRGRIVLLGGTFWEGRDRHITALGDLAGVEVLAQILETELDGGGPRPPAAWHYFLIQCLAGFAIVAIFRGRELNRAFGLSLLLCGTAAPLASLLVFGTWKLWFYFLPALGVWLIQQLYDEAKTYRDELLLGPERPDPVPAVPSPSQPGSAVDGHDEPHTPPGPMPPAAPAQPRTSPKEKKRRRRGAR